MDNSREMKEEISYEENSSDESDYEESDYDEDDEIICKTEGCTNHRHVCKCGWCRCAT